MADKIVIAGKVNRLSNRRYRVATEKPSEIEAEIDLVEDGPYEVEKLSVDGLPAHMPDGTPIRWFNNFAIKKNGEYIKQRYFVTIKGLSSSRVVIVDGNGNLYYYPGEAKDDTIELTEGDPGIGGAP
jgi:hypothetical protein